MVDTAWSGHTWQYGAAAGSCERGVLGILSYVCIVKLGGICSKN